MSKDQFSDDCPGCRPAIMKVRNGKPTGQPLPDDSPEMRAVLGVWDALTPGEKQAWHRFTCQNSRTLVDLSVAKKFGDRVEEALRRIARPS